MKRISILALILCTCFASVAWGQHSTSRVCTGWREFHRPDMMRWNPCEKVLNVNNVGNLQKKWSYKTGFDGAASSPAVANGVVYIGSDDNNVYALNASTGAKLWSYTTDGEVNSSPAVANGVVYVGSDDGNVHALNAHTGAKLWSYAIGGQVNWSSAAVANGVVYIGSEDSNVYALNASTGALLWSYATGNYVESSPAVANGMVYFGTGYYGAHTLYAFGLP